MKILILGGNGVIGNGIYKILSNKFNVTLLNSNAYDRNENKYIIDKKKKYNLFIHAAGVTDEEIIQYGASKSKKRASIAFQKLVNNLIKNGCNNYVYISSQRVYLNFFNSLKPIFNENKSLTKAHSVYEKCHLLSENIMKKVSKDNNCNSLVIRPGVVYGFPKNPKKVSRPNLIQYSFLDSLIKKNKIEINSSGKQYRNFSYNEDVGKIIFNWLKNKKKKFMISNVKGKIITVLDFAKISVDVYKNKSKIVVGNSKNEKFFKFKINQNIKFKSDINLNLKRYIRSYLLLNKNKKKQN